MKALTIYVADDGSRWDHALKRDALTAEVAAIEALLPPRKSSFRGYIQHDADAYNEAKRRLCDVAAREVGGPWWADVWEKIHVRGIAW